MGSIVLFIILVYLIIKLFVRLCKKRFAFKVLFEEFSENKLISEKTIDQIKYLYGFNYVIFFLKEKIFISCKFNNKRKILKNCGNCSICLGPFTLDEKIFITSCDHVFHEKCMTDYINLIVKDIDPNEKEIENFHNYFQCPNCKEFLFTNRSFLIPKKEENSTDNNKENNNEEHKKGGDIFMVSTKSKPNINNFISTEASSKRNLSRMAKKPKKHIHKKGQNRENINKKENNNVIADTQIIEVENVYKSDMKLKDNMAFHRNEKIDKSSSINENTSDIQSQISKDSKKTNIDKEEENTQ